MADLQTPIFIAAVLLGILTLGFTGAPLLLWTALAAAVLWYAEAQVGLWAVFAVVAVVFNIPMIRARLVSAPLLALLRKLNILPAISETEKVALNSGDVWVEREFFSGKPDFKRMMNETYPDLTSEERAFLDGPVEQLCKMIDDYKIWQNRDLPKDVWDFIKKERFLGMIIPKEYGGLGFTALAHSAVLLKLSTRSVPATITVMVPNSLGPAELLNHYGTDEQKKYYLPRLAKGDEIPCFALTEPTAGSDAASMQANGVVFKGTDGKLYLKLNWNKRYITLAGVSTTLGLAFKLKDPENHLGRGPDLGITCALIPSKSEGVTTNRRHDPLGVPFYNCPTQGKDVVVPIDSIIGGPANAGHGWKMLMECLAAGRGISLPSQATAAGQFVTRVASAYATVRKQFGMSVGGFEGITEPLARISGYSYLLEAARRYTVGAIDQGKKPPVVTAMAKYYFTELQRKILNDGMDILGGAAISKGPRNLLAHAYIAMPISITVEGANILTRTLIIFGQGALRAHPYAFKEVDSIERGDIPAFDKAFWGHIGLIVRNGFRTVLLSLTRGWLAMPYRGGVTAKYYRKLAWASATFAFMADLAMGTLGAKLKMKGKTTGRFADVLGHMYLATAALRRFEAEGRRKEDEPFLCWALEHCFAEIQKAFDGIFANFEAPGLGALLRGPIRWYAAMNSIGRGPSDHLDLTLAAMIQKPGAQRDRFTDGIFVPGVDKTGEQLRRLENAFVLSVESDETFKKVRKAIKKGQLKKMPPKELYAEAAKTGVITQAEYENLAKAEAARLDAVQVDDFSAQEYFPHQGQGPHAGERDARGHAAGGSVRVEQQLAE